MLENVYYCSKRYFIMDLFFLTKLKIRDLNIHLNKKARLKDF
jgi:hypothetical protein